MAGLMKRLPYRTVLAEVRRNINNCGEAVQIMEGLEHLAGDQLQLH
jgi:hypothetical protein